MKLLNIKSFFVDIQNFKPIVNSPVESMSLSIYHMDTYYRVVFIFTILFRWIQRTELYLYILSIGIKIKSLLWYMCIVYLEKRMFEQRVIHAKSKWEWNTEFMGWKVEKDQKCKL